MHGRAIAIALTIVACEGSSRGVDDDGPDEPAEVSTAALAASDPVSAAVAASCSTTAVVGLSTQLVDEIQCMRPGTLKKIDGVSGFALGDAVFPYLQAPAFDAVVAAQKARGATMTVNSALRSLAQQYLLYRWYKVGRCGIRLAAAPGRSNHEAALAVDVADNAAWQKAMAAQEMKWFGSGDPVHFDYAGAGRVELRGLSVLAFQRLWNRNHPDDRIAEDSAYGAATEERLAKSPVGGFAKGADCTQPAPPPSGLPPVATPADPDGAEPAARDPGGDLPDDAGGCTTGARRPGGVSSMFGWFALALLGLVTRRASRSGPPSCRAGSRSATASRPSRAGCLAVRSSSPDTSAASP